MRLGEGHAEGGTALVIVGVTSCTHAHVLVMRPVPQVVEHCDHSPNCQTGGHGRGLQRTACGGGFGAMHMSSDKTVPPTPVQMYTVSCTPPPQVREHGVNFQTFQVGPMALLTSEGLP